MVIAKPENTSRMGKTVWLVSSVTCLDLQRTNSNTFFVMKNSVKLETRRTTVILPFAM